MILYIYRIKIAEISREIIRSATRARVKKVLLVFGENRRNAGTRYLITLFRQTQWRLRSTSAVFKKDPPRSPGKCFPKFVANKSGKKPKYVSNKIFRVRTNRANLLTVYQKTGKLSINTNNLSEYESADGTRIILRYNREICRKRVIRNHV